MTDIGERIAAIDARFDAVKMTDPSTLLAHVKSELEELEAAMAVVDSAEVELGQLLANVVEECGDAMILLARISMHYGASEGSLAMRVSAYKVERRLYHYERLVGSGMEPSEAWQQAKVLVREGS